MIRPVRQTDAAAWHVLRCALWPGISADDHRTAIERFFWAPHEGQGCLIAIEDSHVVGMIELSIRSSAEGWASDQVGHLEGWYVVPAQRRRGIGGALVAAGERWARERRCREFASASALEDAAGQAAHRALGFTEVERIVCYRKMLVGIGGPAGGGGVGVGGVGGVGAPTVFHASRR